MHFLDFEKSIHHILNYEWSKKKRTLRLEIFNKDYENLIMLDTQECNTEICKHSLSNDGEGYSKGFEMFWRNDQSRDGVGEDIWVAYSYLDSKRRFKEYTTEIIPNFSSRHKLTFVYKNTFKLKDENSRFSSNMAINFCIDSPFI